MFGVLVPYIVPIDKHVVTEMKNTRKGKRRAQRQQLYNGKVR